jgi:cell division septum initiation protein DivIVA
VITGASEDAMRALQTENERLLTEIERLRAEITEADLARDIASLDRLTAQSPEAAAADAEERAVLEEAGQLGAMARLLRASDFDRVQDWITGEKLRGTSAGDRFAVIASVCANLIAVSALSVAEHQIAVADIVGQLQQRVHVIMRGILAGAKTAPRLRLIKGERDG